MSLCSVDRSRVRGCPSPGEKRTRTALGATLVGALALGALMPGTAGAAACPNAALRVANLSTLLPDCRAYEQVAPPNKGGVDVGPTTGVPYVTNFPATLFVRPVLGGDGFVFGSMAAMEGATSGWPVGYAARRSDASGWSTSIVSPPGVVEPNNSPAPVAFSDDLTRAAYTLASGMGGQGPGLYLRDAHGNFTWATPGATATVTARGASRDARHVFFESGDPLVSGVPIPPVGVRHVYESFAGGLRLVDQLPGTSMPMPKGAVVGTGGTNPGAFNFGNTRHAISEDGSHVAFTSPPTSTSADPTRTYVRIDGTRTVEASKSQCTRVAPALACNAPAAATFEDAAVDGSQVLFVTKQQLVNDDDDELVDLYRYDVAAGSLTRLSSGVGATHVVGSSDDVSRVYFTDATGSKLYLSDHGTLRLVATSSRFNGSTTCPMGIASTSSDGGVLAFKNNTAVMSADGTSTTPGLYRYDAAGGGTLTQVLAVAGNEVTLGQMGCGDRAALTADGTYLFFTTSASMVDADRNDGDDVYQWHDGTVTLISSGKGFGARFLTVSPGGRDLWFTSFDQLVPSDTDNAQDIYNARIGGGFPVPTATPPCAGETCQGGLVPAPALSGAGSLTYSGLGNLPLPSQRSTRATGSVSVKRPTTVRGTTKVRLSVKAPEAGRIRVSGSGLKRAKKTAKKAKTYRVTVKLSKRSKRILRRKHRVKVRATVRFTPKHGKRSRVRVHVTFKAKKKAHHKRSKRRAESRSRSASTKGGR